MSKSNLSIDRRKQVKQKKLKVLEKDFLEELYQIKKEGIKYDEDQARR